MMTLHHVGYLVKKIDKARTQFEALGFTASSPVVLDESRGVEIQFLMKDDHRIELVSPAREDAVVGNLMKTHRNSPYHLCFETDRFAEDVEHAEQNGFMLFEKPAPAPALENRRVCFLQGSQAGMIEFLEARKEP